MLVCYPWYVFGFLVVLLLLWSPDEVHARNKSPLLDEDGVRIRNKAAECIFGNQVRELGSQWVPDLGVPIGVLYCMKCECVPFHKKRRIVARVQCRSIKKECPLPTCEEPVLLPGRCCKTCEGDMHTPDVIQDVIPQVTVDEEEKSVKHFASLLTGRSSLVLKGDDMQPLLHNQNKNNVIATGRFSFHRKNLYYSFYISDKAARPRALQFVDREGQILEEHILTGGGTITSLYQNATRKVCGVWRRLPRQYRLLLKEERMFVVLVWGVKDQPEFTLSGQVMRYVALGTELFSSLLEPAPGTDSVLMAGAGATAIVSTSSAATPSIHIAIVFNGIFSLDDTMDVPVNITLTLEEKKQIILEEVKRVKKPAHELNVIELSSPVAPADLRLLTRGRLVLSVASVHKPDALRLSGNVITRATCELFQTTLSSDRASNPKGTAGLGWLYLNNEGALVYNIQVDDLETAGKGVAITLVDVTNKRKTELEDLTPSWHFGWANGTVDRLGPRVLEPLYSGNLAVNVATEENDSLVKGRLSARLVADALDAPAPMLLKRESNIVPASYVGMAWIYIDSECHLHYDVTLANPLGANEALELYLEELPMIAPGAPVISRYLNEFQTNQLEGSPTEPLPIDELHRLDTGAVFIKIKDKVTKNTVLSALVKQIKVPATCLPNQSDNDVPVTIIDNTDLIYKRSCLHDGRYYEEGIQWTTNTDPCKMCFCQNGKVTCDTATCPKTQCTAPNHRLKATPGECCPVCAPNDEDISNVSAPKGCFMAAKFHSAGSTWHPFLIPEGFDRCTECHCDPDTLEVKCTRQECALDCDERVAVKIPNACCKKCPDTKTENSDNGTLMRDIYVVSAPPEMKTAKEILAEGGCKNLNAPHAPYKNGSEYHPKIGSLGEFKCVLCRCRDGNQKCERKKCTRQMCQNLFRQRRTKYDAANSDTSSYDLPESSCCSLQQCKRFRRHHRTHAS